MSFARVGFTALSLGIALLVLAGGPSWAKADVEVTGEVRIRYEGDDRSFMNETQLESFVLQRARLKVAAKNDQGAGIVVQAQDSRRWGQEGATAVDTQNIDLHQAYIHLEGPFGLGGLEFFGGRQELAYGRHRVIGSFGWNNVGRSFDAARLRFNMDDHWIDVTGGTVADAGAAPGVTVDEDVVMLVGHYMASGGELVVEPLVVYRDRRHTMGSLFQTTVGGYASFGKDRFKVQGDLVFQTGEDISALLAAGDVTVDVSPDANGMVGLKGGYDFYSGDDPRDDNDTPYDFLYPTNHRFYGLMDLAVGRAGPRGLQDIHAHAWYKTGNGIKLVGSFHEFMTDVDVSLADGSDSSLGREIDLKANKMLEAGMMLEIGGGIFLPGKVTEEEVGDENAFWGYAQGTASF